MVPCPLQGVRTLRHPSLRQLQTLSTRGVCPRHFYVDGPRVIICNQDTQTLRVASAGAQEAALDARLLDAKGVCPNCIIHWEPARPGAPPASKKAKGKC